ncbi:ceramide kinase-like protein [Mytilus galloprovincialis]|uniref:Ceramide kinase-like protein n=1 Tax=Mytilus galloprovincialis TaxID=29158 RepID=A0A8B6HFU6_MYTGA|nr:ceramide kinase-like protein [Mytilus galloprovincialis]
MVDYTYSDDGMPIPKHSGAFANPFVSEEDVTNIFDIREDGFDVTLSLANGKISWVSVSGNKGVRSKGLFKKKKGVAEEVLPLEDILGVKIKRRKTPGHHEGEGMCQGFTIYAYQVFGPNNLKERIIELEHPSEKICKEYCEKITDYLDAIKERPKSMKLYIQSHAGPHNSSNIYKQKIQHLFEAANLIVDSTEIQHNEYVKQEMIHLEVDQYDCICCVGGDGTVSKVTTALLNKIQASKHIDLKNGLTPARCHIPLGIIPTGTTNQAAKSVLGQLDPVSAAINIILGRTAAVDVISIFHKDKFLQWGFICQYGFAGNVLKLAKKYNRVGLGSKGLDAAVVKALSKSKFRKYECDIEYLPADPLSSEQQYTVCRTGCDVCVPIDASKQDDNTSDVVEECIVQPFNSSNNSNDFNSLSDTEQLSEEVLEDNPWKASKGSYYHVGLYSIPGNCEVAPEGLSKFTHLSDGAMELVLVKDCSRRDFIRYLKRHGNHKNQFDFPFVEIHRVKDVRFKPRYPMGWNYNDTTYNEVEDRMKSIEHRMSVQGVKSGDAFIIDGENGSIHTPSPRRADSVEDLDDLDDTDEDDEIDDVSPPGSCTGSGNKNNNIYKRKDNVLVNSAPQDQRLVGMQYRQTFADEERWRRKKKVLKKEEKKRIKEESKIQTVWNIDNEICDDTLLSFRVHHGLLSVYGVGLSPDTVFINSPLSCLPLIN